MGRMLNLSLVAQ